jgi:hypothetical protein
VWISWGCWSFAIAVGGMGGAVVEPQFWSLYVAM